MTGKLCQEPLQPVQFVVSHSFWLLHIALTCSAAFIKAAIEAAATSGYGAETLTLLINLTAHACHTNNAW